ncbi:TetR/AcrR family transcriptional regulator [Mycobacterium sp. CBMA293]|uniref:TetR/AcrR family transcriptional regulator n=1 Tax=unclassified Mycolicibacterium TaxID=2636767 RepID=UPI0012DF0CCC|nr:MULTISPECIES: TetR/AcrR family transcriptional regulator [unclassified Mycolicibacterium]MUL44547.1 TetR/AcrR family transcriptional regulator [Mycolicibacterium sp. CBMA 360]MUL59869.1 TetR/AcrR family transcriptional regulator [Mycolicibacterium sp. CBMA 335]MUL66467.1 TetR family transcriptional regulator [Mycolicibacterium sp. CBMA 234]MUL68712.1 TetR/AcrR family transcriptional regulator [Mycolicibacterium sp. CBMA 311]MUL93897.1 TetR/AcrR family transcriptional regulator [Mycolicibact
MCKPARPLRADAARNRARVLEVAYQTFADEGFSVPIDEIARRAGVGAGTVYRHFPTKDDLYRAVIEDRLQSVTDAGRACLASDAPGDALFDFLRSMVRWGETDQGLVDALAGLGIDVNTLVPDVEAEFLALVGELLAAGQRAGTVRPDVSPAEVKALLVAVQAAQRYNPDAAERVVELMMDGLRPR